MLSRSTVPLLALLAGLALLVACAPTPGDDTGTAGTSPTDDTGGDADDGAQAQLIAEVRTDLADEDAAAVGQAVNAFGFDLLGELTDGSETTVISPLSVATLLAMVMAGADGDTATAMAEVLHLDDPRDARVGTLLERLVDTDDVVLRVGNALWVDDDITLHDAYVDLVADVFDATAARLDLGAPSAAEVIDGWVDDRTEGLIDGIADALGVPSDDLAVVLLNAVYFLGEWTTAFDADVTRPAAFTTSDGSVEQVPTMHMAGESFALGSGATADGEGFRVLRLPYGDDGRYGMEILLPDGDLTGLLDGLDADVWREAVDGMAERTVDLLTLPTFELDWDRELTDVLGAMGMAEAFTAGQADFRPMSPVELVLDTVVHATHIRVDEQGTEAAAVTGGAIAVTSAPENPVEFQVDRPFAFTISDAETGTVLFLGAVTDPRG